MKLEAILCDQWTARKKSLEFCFYIDNYKEITICSKVERSYITHNKGMVRENDGTCRDGQTDFFYQRKHSVYIYG